MVYLNVEDRKYDSLLVFDILEGGGGKDDKRREISTIVEE